MKSARIAHSVIVRSIKIGLGQFGKWTWQMWSSPVFVIERILSKAKYHYGTFNNDNCHNKFCTSFCVVNVWWMLFSLLSYLNWYLEIYDAILEVYAVILYAGSSLIEFLLWDQLWCKALTQYGKSGQKSHFILKTSSSLTGEGEVWDFWISDWSITIYPYP